MESEHLIISLWLGSRVKEKGERIIVPVHRQSPIKHRPPMFEHLPIFERNIQTSARSNIGIIALAIAMAMEVFFWGFQKTT